MSGPTYPSILQQPFAHAGIKNAISYASASPNASWYDGFPAITWQPYGSGGVPPAGQDFNGIFYSLSAVLVYANAGGQFLYDAAFASAIGYPLGAIIAANDFSCQFECLSAGTITDPNTFANVDGIHWCVVGGSAALAGNFKQGGGSANAIALSPLPAVSTLYSGMRFAFRPSATNTTAATLNVGTGAVAVVRNDGLAVSAGDLVTGNLYEVIYDAAIPAFMLVGTVASQQSNPTGVVVPFAGASVPTGWLLCDGTGYVATDYPALFALIGYTFGGSAGSFHVPNLQNQFPIGASGTHALASTGGSSTIVANHTHFVANIDTTSWPPSGPYSTLTDTPSNSMIDWVQGASHVEAYQLVGSATVPTAGHTSGPQGATVGADSLPPFVALNYIIKA